MAMRVLCVTLLLLAGAQGVRLQKDKDGALQKEKDSEASYRSALHAAAEHAAEKVYANPEERASAVEAVSEMFQAFNKLDGQDPEKVDAKAVDDLSTKNFG